MRFGSDLSDHPSSGTRYKALLIAAILITATSGCAKIEDLRERYTPQSPREAYEYGLDAAGLKGSALANAWLQAADESFNDPVAPDLPYRETGFLDPAVPLADAFSIPLRRGQRLVAGAWFVEPDSGQIFLDLFRQMDDLGLGLRRVSMSDSNQTLVFDATSNGDFILRFQPELLAGGRYELTLTITASIIFPVSGKTSGAIQSVFGDARDGGRRDHHGVDIFAPRGTPVVAATDGVVSSTRIGGLGGKTVWLRSPEVGGNLYYAHLDEQLVSRGQRVLAGDTLGLVGNTGNAITTPPHLHFGIYRNGPVDPYPYVHEPDQRMPTLLADAARTGTWMRTAVAPSVLRPGPSTRSGEKLSLEENASVQILAAASRYYRVRLPDGTHGYIGAVQVESEDAVLDELILAATTPVQRVPQSGAGPMVIEESGSAVHVRSRYGDYLRVTTDEGQTGWVRDTL